MKKLRDADAAVIEEQQDADAERAAYLRETRKWFTRLQPETDADDAEQLPLTWEKPNLEESR